MTRPSETRQDNTRRGRYTSSSKIVSINDLFVPSKQAIEFALYMRTQHELNQGAKICRRISRTICSYPVGRYRVALLTPTIPISMTRFPCYIHDNLWELVVAYYDKDSVCDSLSELAYISSLSVLLYIHVLRIPALALNRRDGER